MTESVDLRKKVVAFVHDGCGQAEAAAYDGVSLWYGRDWLVRKDLQPQQKDGATSEKLPNRFGRSRHGMPAR